MKRIAPFSTDITATDATTRAALSFCAKLRLLRARHARGAGDVERVEEREDGRGQLASNQGRGDAFGGDGVGECGGRVRGGGVWGGAGGWLGSGSSLGAELATAQM